MGHCLIESQWQNSISHRSDALVNELHMTNETFSSLSQRHESRLTIGLCENCDLRAIFILSRLYLLKLIVAIGV